MSNKHSAYIDLAKLQGAQLIQVKGTACLLLNIPMSRAKLKGDKLYLNLSLVPNKDGKDDFGNTHWITEPTTKEEREIHQLKLPIIGNSREYDGERRESNGGGQAGSSRGPGYKFTAEDLEEFGINPADVEGM